MNTLTTPFPKRMLWAILTLCMFYLSSCRTNMEPPAVKVTRRYDANGGVEANRKRMLIYHTHITVVVANTDTASALLSALAQSKGGLVERQSNTLTTLRIPVDKLEETVKHIGTLGKVTAKDISISDITDAHSDLELRLDNARNARKRYLELLAKAENVEAALKVEKELERLNGEITQMENTISRNEKDVAYSTVQVYLKAKTKPGILGYVGMGLYYSVKWLFVR